MKKHFFDTNGAKIVLNWVLLMNFVLMSMNILFDDDESCFLIFAFYSFKYSIFSMALLHFTDYILTT